ncbi:MAG: protein translocase subunit SecF [Halobacteriovoraceae bacterium]|nr:protein translocase subunit SecF [Halobacteriovoraceae bacterium]MCB9095156.1 protein translocase subunit SecF [Halobacteriovoraceae bacterium]
MNKLNIDFVGKFALAVTISSLAVLGSLYLIFFQGLNLGVDFRGGAEIQVKFAQDVSDVGVRDSLAKSDYNVSSVQSIGEANQNEFLIKVAASKDEDINKLTTKITEHLSESFAAQGIEIRKTDIVGPKAGQQLQISGVYAMLMALAAILIYIGLRFDFKYSPGAVVALFHDVLIICGIFVLTDKEFSLQIVGALLAVIGYSVNDTVVVYDRVREHEEKRVGGKLKEHINNALNETLSRTTLTSATTLFVGIAMFYFGGGIIHDFFFAIVLGVFIGTYSSLFIAAPTVLFLSKFQKS